MSLYYIILVIAVPLVLGIGASAYVRNQLKKYSTVSSSSGLTGYQAAMKMLNDNGIYNVQVFRGVEGADHFDPRTNSISLSPSVFDESSVTAYATACHEVGHACQFAMGYGPLKARSALFPAVNFASKAWPVVFIAGLFLAASAPRMGSYLYMGAVILYAIVVLFQIVTLPVEFNASHRAMDYMKAVGLPQSETSGAFSVLRACALTYVAAALASLAQLLYLVLLARD